MPEYTCLLLLSDGQCDTVLVDPTMLAESLGAAATFVGAIDDMHTVLPSESNAGPPNVCCTGQRFFATTVFGGVHIGRSDENGEVSDLNAQAVLAYMDAIAT